MDDGDRQPQAERAGYDQREPAFAVVPLRQAEAGATRTARATRSTPWTFRPAALENILDPGGAAGRFLGIAAWQPGVARPARLVSLAGRRLASRGSSTFRRAAFATAITIALGGAAPRTALACHGQRNAFD